MPLDDAPGAGLDRRRGRVELVAQLGGDGVEPRLGSRGLADLGEEGLERRSGLLTIARRTSRHWTLPEPSQIEFSGASR